MFGEAVAVMPGFINLKLSEAFLADYMKGMAEADKLGLEEPEKGNDHRGLRRRQCGKAPSLGHLRSAIIGEHQAHGPFYGI